MVKSDAPLMNPMFAGYIEYLDVVSACLVSAIDMAVTNARTAVN